MKTKVYLLITFVAILFLSCNKNNNEENQPVNITPVEIAKNHFMSNHVNPSNYVIKTQIEWNNFIALINNSINVNYVIGQPNIDFQNDMVIAIIDSVYSTGGWSVDITNVIENSNSITVNYTNLETGDDTMIVVQPFEIVKIPKSNKPIEFIKN